MKTLILGYGNPLRGDDALGWKLAEKGRQLGFSVLTQQQLLPELAPELAKHERVIFADASLHGEAAKLLRLPSSSTANWPLHCAGPAQLLALCQEVYGHQPEAWWLTMPGKNFELGRGLSARARSSLRQGLTLLRGLLPN